MFHDVCHGALLVRMVFAMVHYWYALHCIQIMRAIGDVLGKSIWKRTALVLTHGNLAQTPSGTDYGEGGPNPGNQPHKSVFVSSDIYVYFLS